MLALEMLGRRAHNDHPNNFSRSPPYTEDVKWLLGLAARLGNHLILNNALKKSFPLSCCNERFDWRINVQQHNVIAHVKMREQFRVFMLLRLYILCFVVRGSPHTDPCLFKCCPVLLYHTLHKVSFSFL